MIRHSFAPFEPDAVDLLSKTIGIDYHDCDFASDRWLCVTARENGRLLGCCMFEFPIWFEAYFSTVIIEPRCLTRRVLRAMFKAVFTRAVRVTAEIPPSNIEVIAKAQRMGFTIEGLKALGLDGRRDALILGMTRDACRVLRKVSPALSTLDQTDGHLLDTKAGGDSGLRSSGSSDLPDKIRRKLGHLVALAGLIVGMAWPLGGIGLPARPAQMALIDASSDPAGMGSVGHPVGSRPMLQGADQVMDAADLTLVVHLPVAVAVERMGPNQAFVGLVGQNDISEVALNDAGLCHGGRIIRTV